MLRFLIKNKLRRVRDSNPWYSYPYACLANKSFRPLRQLSKLKERVLFCGCKLKTCLRFSQLFQHFFFIFFNYFLKLLHYQSYSFNHKTVFSTIKSIKCPFPISKYLNHFFNIILNMFLFSQTWLIIFISSKNKYL